MDKIEITVCALLRAVSQMEHEVDKNPFFTVTRAELARCLDGLELAATLVAGSSYGLASWAARQAVKPLLDSANWTVAATWSDGYLYDSSGNQLSTGVTPAMIRNAMGDLR